MATERTGGGRGDGARCASSSTRKGHAVDNARDAVARLELAFADGDLVRDAVPDPGAGRPEVALEQDEGQKLGGKSAEASRFILRAIDRELRRGIGETASDGGYTSD